MPAKVGICRDNSRTLYTTINPYPHLQVTTCIVVRIVRSYVTEWRKSALCRCLRWCVYTWRDSDTTSCTRVKSAAMCHFLSRHSTSLNIWKPVSCIIVILLAWPETVIWLFCWLEITRLVWLAWDRLAVCFGCVGCLVDRTQHTQRACPRLLCDWMLYMYEKSDLW